MIAMNANKHKHKDTTFMIADTAETVNRITEATPIDRSYIADCWPSLVPLYCTYVLVK